MRTVKVCYSIRDNIGDSINPLIIERIIGYKVQHAEWNECETSGIGSGLRRFFMQRSEVFASREGFRRKLMGVTAFHPCQLWSAGFICHCDKKEIPVRSNLKVASVRGVLSKQRVEKILGKPLDCTLGDAGLLAAGLLKEKTHKKYRLGIIAHQREIGEKEWDYLHDTISGSILLDVTADPMETLKKMSECECIISSSLHGLIIADSFGIPNQRVILTDRLAGDGFKFDDYYSAFGIMPNPPINLKESIAIDIEKIKAGYQIKSEWVEQKKTECVRSFSKYLT